MLINGHIQSARIIINQFDVLIYPLFLIPWLSGIMTNQQRNDDSNI